MAELRLPAPAQVAGLVRPELLIEVEAIASLAGEASSR
jgi:hypothetical protein